MNNHPRLGLFFCRCGPNLGQVVRLERLSDPANWPSAVVVQTHDTLCSEDGKAWLEARILEDRLDRVVVAACSPREHESTFQKVLAAAGLNPYMLNAVNIREQCEWLGGDRDEATAKAVALVMAGMKRVLRHEPIKVEEIDCNPDVLVLGAGAAGISSAINLSQKNRRVVLAEKSFALGGRVFLLDEAYPGMECASCFLEPALAKVLHDENIQILTGAEVSGVVGSYGNFTVTMTVRARRVDPEACLGCRSCAGACPVEFPDPYSGGRGTRKAVDVPFEGCLPHVSVVDGEMCLHLKDGSCDACMGVCPFGAIMLDEADSKIDIHCGAVVIATGSESCRPEADDGLADVLDAFQMERMIHPNGPTGGSITCSDGKVPVSILFALSRDARDEGPLGWMELLKLAERTRHKLPKASITLAGGSAWTLGAGHDLIAGLREHGAELVQAFLGGIAADPATGKPLAYLGSEGGVSTVVADMVVVYRGSRPSGGTEELGRLFRLRVRQNGFFEDRAGPFEPSFSGVEGVCIAGCAGGPRTIAASIQDGAAAAARVLSQLVPGEKIALEPLASEVDDSLCSGCRVCRALCPYGAITGDGEGGKSAVIAALCRGCGTCAAACPSGAIRARNFTTGQLVAEIEGLLALD